MLKEKYIWQLIIHNHILSAPNLFLNCFLRQENDIEYPLLTMIFIQKLPWFRIVINVFCIAR